MKYELDVAAVIHADAAAAWSVWTDIDRFPSWDPRERRNRLDGPFAVGTTGSSKQKGAPGGSYTICRIEPGRSWQATSTLPGGALTIDHRVEDLAGGQVRVSKRYVATGPMALAFRWWFGPAIRRAMPASFTALAAEAARRRGTMPA
jgi:hypothetical protein